VGGRFLGRFFLKTSTVLIVGLTCAGVAAARQNGSPAEAKLKASYLKSPLAFEANRGQFDADIKFFSRGLGYALALTDTEAIFVLKNGAAGVGAGAIRMRLGGASPKSRVAGLDQLTGKTNYFTGKDKNHWHSDVPMFAKVAYQDVYPGVNLVYYGNQEQVEYDFVVAPGANPKQIELVFSGTEGLRIDNDGNLLLGVSGGELAQHKPIVYQMVHNRKARVRGKYVLRGGDSVGFKIGRYDETLPLYIDPVLSYATYLGGRYQDYGYSVAVDSSGAIYVTGRTDSNSSPFFPTTGGAYDTSANGDWDAFVTKFNSNGTLAYSTFLGGGNQDEGWGIAVDNSGNAYIAGFAISSDFPTQSAVQKFSNINDSANGNAFVTKLNPAGNALVYSTYLGGEALDRAYAIAIDSGGYAYVTGVANSTGFPVIPAMTAYQRTNGGAGDVFVTQLSTGGNALVYSTYLGGSADEIGYAIAVDSSDYAYVTGYTQSSNYPATMGAFDTSYGGGKDALVTQLNQTGTALVYSTFLGGSGNDEGHGIAADTSGNAYVAGITYSTDFSTGSAYQGSYGGSGDAFITKINPAGTALTYSTYLGGSGLDEGWAVSIDAARSVYVAGNTLSANFPTASSIQSSLSGSADAFVTKLSSTGASLSFSSYYGGTGIDRSYGIAVDSGTKVSVVGYAQSTNLTVSGNAYQSTNQDGVADQGDAFLFQLSSPPDAPANLAGAGQGVSSITWSWSDVAGEDNFAVLTSTNGSVSGNLSANTVTWIETALSTNTAYSRKVAASNTAGASTSSAVIAYTLAALPASLAVQGVVGSSVTLSWSANTNPSSTQYRVSYWQITGSTATSTVSVASATVPSLSENTTYYFAVRALNGDSILTSYSNIVSTKTLFASVPGTPTLLATVLGVSSITWNWVDVSSETAYRIALATDTTTSVALLTQNATQYTETALSTNTAYARVLIASNNIGASTSSSKTAYAFAAPPTNFMASQVFISSMNFSWNANTNPSGTVYRVSYWQATGSTSTAEVTSTTHTLTSLGGGNTYYFYLQAKNGDAVLTNPTVTASSVTLPAVAVSRSAPPSSSTSITFSPAPGDVVVDIPAGTFSDAVTVTVQTPTTVPSPTSPTASMRASGVVAEIFLDKSLTTLKEVTVTMNYRDSDVSGLDENKLAIAHYDSARSVWVPLESVPDPVNNKVTAYTRSFSIFEIMELAAQSTLNSVKVFPNPFIPSNGHFRITFSSLPNDAKLTVYALSGEKLRQLSANASGLAFWDGKNIAGQDVASGIYLVYIEGGGSNRTLKLGVER